MSHSMYEKGMLEPSLLSPSVMHSSCSPNFSLTSKVSNLISLNSSGPQWASKLSQVRAGLKIKVGCLPIFP